jgi:hypothetical protein
VALGIDTANLTEAYQHFKDEAQQLNPEYQPETVKTDGWEATQKVWRSLFPLVLIIECFWHAFIKIRARGKHLKETFHLLSENVTISAHPFSKNNLLFVPAREILDVLVERPSRKQILYVKGHSLSTFVFLIQAKACYVKSFKGLRMMICPTPPCTSLLTFD